MSPRASTRSERAFRAVRADILSGRLTPGARLPFADLCARYDSSMGVLREGLSRLAEQGLVVLEPQQGYRVAPLSAADLADLTEARVQVETLVLRAAIEHGDLAWESRLIGFHHTLARTTQMDPDDPARFADAWTDAHATFHNAVLDGCPNRRLKDVAHRLRDSAELYRRWSVPLGHDEDRDIAGEHEALLHAVLARDADRAAGLLVAHISRTTQVLLERADGSGSRAIA